MSIDLIPFAGWQKNLRLTNSSSELIISLEVGPRVLSYRPLDGTNIFYNYPAHLGGFGETEWMNRGGHRVWISPEHAELSYQPDNEPFPYDILGENAVKLITPAKGEWQIRKELTLELTANGVTVTHTLVNESTETHSVAPWALSVMTQGGISILPQPPLGEHPRDLLPDRALVFWPYADLTDPRLHLGRYFITLRHDPKGLPIKFGLAHRGNWAAYLVGDQLFTKAFTFIEGATYPDFGCNYESFTNQDMLEVETLGPLTHLAPGDAISHVEKWQILGGLTPPPYEDTPGFAQWLTPYLP